MIYGLLRTALFRLEAEDAHELIARQLERVGSIPMVRDIVQRATRVTPAAEATVWGLRFRTRLGIAAGFDKNGVMVPILAALGFGFIEVGTVTLQAQPGNARPRLFRLPAERALINRLGFNNDGAAVVAARLATAWQGVEHRVPLLVNIGKNRDVSLADAVANYKECYRVVGPVADGVVINVSSPNTPGLRDLQNPEQLSAILDAVRETREQVRFLREGTHPLLVKISPDLTQQQLEEVAGVCVGKADGMIATNTTVSREGLTRDPDLIGGLSGGPLFTRSNDVLRRLRSIVGQAFPLIGAGGIFSLSDAEGKRQAGADLVQTYTGFVYEGPAMPAKIGRKLR